MAKKSDYEAIEQPASGEFLTVTELAQKHGEYKEPSIGGDTPFTRVHLGADAAHGWTRHKVHRAKEARMTDADYLAALDAFKAGKLHEGANLRPLTVFSEEHMKAKYDADRTKPKTPRPVPMSATELLKSKQAKAFALANSGKRSR